jgi:hypothetical protein
VKDVLVVLPSSMGVTLMQEAYVVYTLKQQRSRGTASKQFSQEEGMSLGPSERADT